MWSTRKPAISVLLPCYNAAGTLPEALASLSRQTFLDFEILAVDDGSTDRTPEILRDWAESDNRLRVVYQTHAGIIAALNTGLQACRAGIIARMDTDDRSHPDRLKRQAAFMDGNPEIAVVSCLVAGFPAGQVREGFQIYLGWSNSLVNDEDIRREIFVESPLVHPSVMFRRSWIERAGGYQERGWPEDYDLWLRLYLAGARFAKLPEVLLEWREHPGRLTRTDGRYSLENFLRAKANYLALGPLAGCEAVILWGAGMLGRRLSKQLSRLGVPLAGFIDIDPRKIGGSLRGLPIYAPEDLPELWRRHSNPAILAAVGARGARQIIRRRLNGMGFCEGQDWWSAA
jgi:glycosyltransferase involved in cell wall biosynthesis